MKKIEKIRYIFEPIAIYLTRKNLNENTDRSMCEIKDALIGLLECLSQALQPKLFAHSNIIEDCILINISLQ